MCLQTYRLKSQQLTFPPPSLFPDLSQQVVIRSLQISHSLSPWHEFRFCTITEHQTNQQSCGKFVTKMRPMPRVAVFPHKILNYIHESPFLSLRYKVTTLTNVFWCYIKEPQIFISGISCLAPRLPTAWETPDHVCLHPIKPRLRLFDALNRYEFLLLQSISFSQMDELWSIPLLLSWVVVFFIPLTLQQPHSAANMHCSSYCSMELVIGIPTREHTFEQKSPRKSQRSIEVFRSCH